MRSTSLSPRPRGSTRLLARDQPSARSFTRCRDTPPLPRSARPLRGYERILHVVARTARASPNVLAGQVTSLSQRQSHEGAVPTPAAAAEWPARPESCACVKRPGRSKRWQRPCLQPHAVIAALACNLDEVIDQRATDPTTSGSPRGVHGLQLTVARLNLLQRSNCEPPLER